MQRSQQHKPQSRKAATASADKDRLVRMLIVREAFARKEDRRAVVFARPMQVTLRAGSVGVSALNALVSAGAVARREGRGGGEYRLTEAGMALARRLEQNGHEDQFSRQHLKLRQIPALGEPEITITINEAESPLLWLYRRKGRSGAGLIGDAEFAAGERLRADVSRAGMLPRLTADWERESMPTSSSAGLNPTEALMAARQRVGRALSMVGPEFSGLLLDVCGFLKSIELVERERGWPARSAKVVLVLALQKLARHYGLSNKALGARRAGNLEMWGSEGYRPDFISDDAAASGQSAAGVGPDSLHHGSQPV